ncbi:MAG: tail fiber domain-containing protein [Candidatus Pacebacteria bacterium]|nr:tail fiber domain-containing protein [Candidatus Paceibacterota bacterium]
MKKILIFILLIIFTTSFSFAASYQLSNFDKLSLYVYCTFAFCEEKEEKLLVQEKKSELLIQVEEKTPSVQVEKKTYPVQVEEKIEETKHIKYTNPIVQKTIKEQPIVNNTYPTTVVNTTVKETVTNTINLDEVSDIENDIKNLERKIKSNRSLISTTLSVASDDLSDNFINDLSDVNATTPTDGQILVWDTATSKWVTGSMATSSDTQDLSIVGHTISLVDGGSVVVPDNDTTYTNISEFVNDSGYLTTIGAQPFDALQNVDAMTEADDDILFFDTDGWNRLAHGTDGQVLKYTTVGGVTWATESGGGASQLTDLTDVNTAGITSGNILMADGTDWESVAQTSITSLGTIGAGVWNGTDVAVADGGTGASDASTARTNLGLVISTNVQAWDADLDDLADGTLSKTKIQDYANWDTAYGWGNHASGGYLTTVGAQPLDALQNVDTMTEADNDILFYDTDGWNRLAHGTDGQVLEYTTAGGVTWADGSSSLWTANGSDIYFNTGDVGIGNTAPRVALDLGDGVGGGGGDGAILAMGLQTSGWTEPNLGLGTRFMWYPRKSALRAGYVNGTQWDDVNIGSYSTAVGYGTIASASYSIATGRDTAASGTYSTSMGYNSIASGDGSTALGFYTEATGNYSFAVGRSTDASGVYATSMGYNSTASGSSSTALGRGTTASGDSSTALGYYSTASGDYSVAIGHSITAGTNSHVVAISLDDSVRTCNQANSMCITGGEVGIGDLSPTALLHLNPSTTTRSQFRLETSAGTNPTAPNSGDLWWNGTNLNFYDGASTNDLLAGSGAFTDGGTLAYYNGGNVGIGDTTPDFKLELAGTSSVTDRKIGINDVQVVYLPDQTDFLNSIFFGNGGQNLSFVLGNDGRYNTGVGIDALSAITLGYYNTALGYQSLYATQDSGFNVAIGPQTLFTNTVGDNNVAVGYRALYLNTSGDANVASGLRSLYSNTTGDYNVAMGYQALHGNVANSRSIAIGYNAMQFADNRTTGQGTYNIAVGYEALRGSFVIADNIGRYNTALGDSSLIVNSSGYNNTATGYNALSVNTTGYNNTAIGYQALITNTTGYNNTVLGYSADVSGNNYTNAMALGNGALVTASNYVRIGDTAVTRIGGQVAWSNLSDVRKKENIEDSSLGLDFILDLRPVTFNFKEGQTDILYTGLIAQEVETALEGVEFSGLNKPANDSDYYSLGYASFVTPLINATQEIWNKVFTNQEEILELKEKFDEKDSEIEMLKSELCKNDNSYSWCVQNIEKPIEPEPILGCTDETAINYKLEATEDDGSCEY